MSQPPSRSCTGRINVMMGEHAALMEDELGDDSTTSKSTLEDEREVLRQAQAQVL